MLENGANLNARDILGRSMLHYLVQSDNTGEATEWLINQTGEALDIDARTNAGVTSLMLAVKRDNAKTVQALLNGRANPFFADQLAQEASDYKVAVKSSEKTYPVHEMVEMAKEQWLNSVTKEEALVDQPEKDPHF